MDWPHHPALAIQAGGGPPWRAPRRVVDWIRATGCSLVVGSLTGMWLLSASDHLLLNLLLHVGCIALVILCHYHLYEVVTAE